MCCGTALYIETQVHQELEAQDISTELVGMHTVKPLDSQYLQKMTEYDLMVTLEEHSLIGGLGSAVLEWINDECQRVVNLLRRGIADEFIDRLHDPESARR